MIENNNIDNLFRSALENAQEEVPEQVWEGISSSLDRIARRKHTVIIFRRICAGTAVAAGLVAGAVLGFKAGEQQDIINESSSPELISLVETPVQEDYTALAQKGYTADIQVYETADARADETGDARGHETFSTAKDDAIALYDTVSPKEDIDSAVSSREDAEERAPESVKQENSPWTPVIWEETPARKQKIRTSLSISGLTAMADNRPRQTPGMMKRPSIAKVQKETGVSEGTGNGVFGFPVSIGAGVKIDFTPRWSLSAGLRYTLLTRKFYGTYNYVSEDGLSDWSESCDIRNTQHYIGIPLQASFNIITSNLLNFYVYAGGAAEKCVDNNYLMLRSSTVHREPAKGIQFSVDAGLGLEFLVGKYIGIYLDPSVRYYFNNSQPKSLRTYQPLMFGVEAGLRIHI